MIALPGLRGDDPLGFLAAVGLIALSEQELLPPLRLRWTEGASPAAVVEGGWGTLGELEAALDSAFRMWTAAEGVLPGADPTLPLAKQGTGSDPMRMAPQEMARLFADAGAREHEAADPWTARWLLALAAQTATKEKGDVVLTPFYAPTGQMALRSSLFELVADGVRKVGGPADALTAWVRTSAFKGANFDERALRDAATSSNGQPANLGAPSPTWLAVMGIRMFPVVERAGRARTVGWQAVRMRGYSRSLVWPVWTTPLDAPAVRVLLAASALEVAVRQDRLRLAGAGALPALGVTAVFLSRRRTLSQGDGPLGPAQLVWPSAGS